MIGSNRGLALQPQVAALQELTVASPEGAARLARRLKDGFFLDDAGAAAGSAPAGDVAATIRIAAALRFFLSCAPASAVARREARSQAVEETVGSEDNRDVGLSAAQELIAAVEATLGAQGVSSIAEDERWLLQLDHADCHGHRDWESNTCQGNAGELSSGAVLQTATGGNSDAAVDTAVLSELVRLRLEQKRVLLAASHLLKAYCKAPR